MGGIDGRDRWDGIDAKLDEGKDRGADGERRDRSKDRGIDRPVLFWLSSEDFRILTGKSAKSSKNTFFLKIMRPGFNVYFLTDHSTCP
jgi:hypothetical protein